MITIIFLILVILVIAFYKAMKTNLEWETRKMFCYFEWTYKNEVGSSKDYGPMCELDAIGAMQYRQSLGAQITFTEYKTNPDDICDIIDQRQHYHSIQENRKSRGWGAVQ